MNTYCIFRYPASILAICIAVCASAHHTKIQYARNCKEALQFANKSSAVATCGRSASCPDIGQCVTLPPHFTIDHDKYIKSKCFTAAQYASEQYLKSTKILCTNVTKKLANNDGNLVSQ